MMRAFIKNILSRTRIYMLIRHKQIRKEMENRREIFQRQYPGLSTPYFVHQTARLELPELIEIGEGTEINEYVIIRSRVHKVKIGKYTQLNPFTVIYGGTGVTVGDNVMIAPHCMIASGNHDYKQTSYPMRFAGTLSKGPIIIEDNVWIGANCTIVDGVRIGKESVIAANSVVVKDVEPWSIMSGVPAIKIGSRLEQK